MGGVAPGIFSGLGSGAGAGMAASMGAGIPDMSGAMLLGGGGLAPTPAVLPPPTPLPVDVGAAGAAELMTPQVASAPAAGIMPAPVPDAGVTDLTSMLQRAQDMQRMLPVQPQPRGDVAGPAAAPGPVAPQYLEQIKKFEGYASKPQWDYKQWSSGYGTRAKHPGEVIDRATAEQRLQAELGSARAVVDRVAPNAPDGVKAALTSLTYNAGDSWTRGGLGSAVRAGDWRTAQRIFQQYNKAGGQTLPGLVNRRTAEARWFDQSQPAGQTPTQIAGSPPPLRQFPQVAQADFPQPGAATSAPPTPGPWQGLADRGDQTRGPAHGPVPPSMTMAEAAPRGPGSFAAPQLQPPTPYGPLPPLPPQADPVMGAGRFAQQEIAPPPNEMIAAKPAVPSSADVFSGRMADAGDPMRSAPALPPGLTPQDLETYGPHIAQPIVPPGPPSGARIGDLADMLQGDPGRVGQFAGLPPPASTAVASAAPPGPTTGDIHAGMNRPRGKSEPGVADSFMGSTLRKMAEAGASSGKVDAETGQPVGPQRTEVAAATDWKPNWRAAQAMAALGKTQPLAVPAPAYIPSRPKVVAQAPRGDKRMRRFQSAFPINDETA